MSLLLAGHGLQQIFLYQIAVLILVGEYFGKMLTVFQRHIPGPYGFIFPVQQNVQREMLHIGKINDLFLLLLFLHPSVKVQRQIQQGAHGRQTCAALSGSQFQGCGEKTLFQIPDAVLHGSPHFFGKFPLYR